MVSQPRRPWYAVFTVKTSYIVLICYSVGIYNFLEKSNICLLKSVDEEYIVAHNTESRQK
jgi:hypothetical protein